MSFSLSPYACLAELRQMGRMIRARARASSRGRASRRMHLRDEPDHAAASSPADEGARDLALARAAIAGEEPAREAVIERLADLPAMLRIKNLRLGGILNAHELEDAAQGALAALWKKLAQFDGRVPLLYWAYGFALVELRRTVERRARRREKFEDPDQMPALAPTVNADVELVRRVLAEVGEPDRSIVTLKHFNGLTFEEIAVRTGVVLNTVKSKYYRTLERLKDRLSSWFREEERHDI